MGVSKYVTHGIGIFVNKEYLINICKDEDIVDEYFNEVSEYVKLEYYGDTWIEESKAVLLVKDIFKDGINGMSHRILKFCEFLDTNNITWSKLEEIGERYDV